MYQVSEKLKVLVEGISSKESQLINEMSKKVINKYGYPPELEFFSQPYKEGKRQGFYRWSLSKFLDESDVVCYIYSYYDSDKETYNFEEYWNVK